MLNSETGIGSFENTSSNVNVIFSYVVNERFGWRNLVLIVMMQLRLTVTLHCKLPTIHTWIN